MKRVEHLTAFILVIIGCIIGLISPISPVYADSLDFDVNDVSFLWPVPRSEQDVTHLISAAEINIKGGQIWPQSAFDTVIETAQNVKAGNNTIDFSPSFATQVSKAETWKIAGLRIDPCSPGSDQAISQVFGCSPQLRIIAQPVTVSAAGPKVHDLTAHLVFKFVKDEGTGQQLIPDKDKFQEIVSDLKLLKSELELAGINTAGDLSVHPGLKANVPGFEEKLESFIKKHVSEEKLSGVAFMGLDGRVEPWIFFAMSKLPNGTLVQAPFPTLGGKNAQMITGTSFGQRIIPVPTTTNLTSNQGVSTAMLLGIGIANRLDNPVFPDRLEPQIQDIPDIIANPNKAHFFNTDCVSCHSANILSSQLTALGSGKYRYKLPANISGIDISLLPQSRWNVRNFGWFPPASPNRAAVPTVSIRTANEAAESADYINHNYVSNRISSNTQN